MSQTKLELVVAPERACTSCKQLRPITDFRMRKNRKWTFLHSKCKTCHAESAKKFRRENRTSCSWTQLKSKYGLTQDAARKLLADQMHLCANRACGQKLSFDVSRANISRANIDHCHETGKVRGALCRPCNVALGWLEQKNRVLGLTEYLDKHSSLA